MSLTRIASIVRPDKWGQQATEAIAEEEIEEMFIPARSDNLSPWGDIGTVNELIPDPFSNWINHQAAGWDDGGTEGMSASVPIPITFRGQTIEVFLNFSHVSATASGDIRVQMDVGPREHLQAQGAPNDADSTRVMTTITVAAGAGDNQHAPQYVSLGTFDISADDRLLLFEVKRLGLDGADTFAASIGAFGCLLVVQ